MFGHGATAVADAMLHAWRGSGNSNSRRRSRGDSSGDGAAAAVVTSKLKNMQACRNLKLPREQDGGERGD